MNIIEITLKFYLYQILAILVIWSGMTYFKDSFHSGGMIIYYLVTGWLLLLIVVTIRRYFGDKDKQDDEADK